MIYENRRNPDQERLQVHQRSISRIQKAQTMDDHQEPDSIGGHSRNEGDDIQGGAVNFEVAPVDKPKRKNVRISRDPQTVAARQRREKIREKIRVLQMLVPGGSKMDTASMLDEAANYLKAFETYLAGLQ